MLKNRLVSVIVSTKNEEDNISTLLNSVKSQSYKSIEIIVVDNNSSDETKLIARKFTNKVYNYGPERSSQRNFGSKKSKGIFLFFLDADMVLERNVIKECVGEIEDARLGNIGAVVIPEKSFGEGFWVKFKIFEREFYEGEESIEAARFFNKSVFQKFGGYDTSITGPEDYDLPLRMRKSNVIIGRVKSYILHNEKVFSPINSAKKKFYYASRAQAYLKKHPEMIFRQGNLIFREVFIKKWKKLLEHPVLSSGMFIIKTIEMVGALSGAFYAVLTLGVLRNIIRKSN